MMAEDHIYSETEDDSIITNTSGSSAVADEVLMGMLKDLRKNAQNNWVCLLLLFFKILL